MRLICPECGVEYEIDDDLIPEAGRDVQCSNCGHSWFHRPPPLTSELADELGTDPDLAPPGEGRTSAAERLDPKVHQILREEAERELRARQGSPRVETQPDLGLTGVAAMAAPAAMAPAATAHASMPAPAARHPEPALPTDTVRTPPAPRPSRRDLLPDVESVSSVLHPALGARSEPAPKPPRRGGFASGFLTVLVLAAAAAAIYVYAEPITARVPRLGPALATYVGWIDGLRAWLAELVQRLLALRS